MQDADLLAKRPPDNEQRFDQLGQVGKVLKLIYAADEERRISGSGLCASTA